MMITARWLAGISITAVLMISTGCGDESQPPTPVRDSAAEATAPKASAEPEPAIAVPSSEEIAAMHARLLADVVTDDGLVRYDVLAQGEQREALDAIIAHYAAQPLPADRDQRLALWCNAYNANVLVMALDESRKAGFETVADVPGFFDELRITVAGEELTLNELACDRIGAMGDARIHAALVFAAMSCPPMRNEPYAAAILDAQLDDQCRRWVSDMAKFRLIDGVLGLSEILKRHAADFDGSPFGNVIGFVLAYADPSSEITRYIVNSDDPQVRWLEFDWTLNRAPTRADPAGR